MGCIHCFKRPAAVIPLIGDDIGPEFYNNAAVLITYTDPSLHTSMKLSNLSLRSMTKLCILLPWPV